MESSVHSILMASLREKRTAIVVYAMGRRLNGIGKCVVFNCSVMIRILKYSIRASLTSLISLTS